jgi:hypothetical protein
MKPSDLINILHNNAIKDIQAEEDKSMFAAINSAVGITSPEENNVQGPGVPIDPEHKKVKKTKKKSKPNVKPPKVNKGDVIEVFE